MSNDGYSSATYALGIDVGTTFTAAAIARHGRAEMVTLGYHPTSVPSVVFLTPEGDFLVGDAAERRSPEAPDRVAREFKRRAGDSTPLLLGGSPTAVDRCYAEMLRWTYAKVVETEGRPPGALTVTHPANWGEFKRDVLRHSLRLAELPEATLLPEPIAAATWYANAERLGNGATVAVYDLGGGTFDAAVVRGDEREEFRILGQSEGIDRLGGVDIDEAVLGHVQRAIGHQAMPPPGEADDPEWATAMARLRRECVAAKEALSADTSATIPVFLPNLQHSVLLHRSELEELVRPLLTPTVQALTRTVSSAGLAFGDLDAVLLVGGASRMPLIAHDILAGLSQRVVVDAHPKHPVALGAALEADARLAGQPEPVLEPEVEVVPAAVVAEPPEEPPATEPEQLGFLESNGPDRGPFLSKKPIKPQGRGKFLVAAAILVLVLGVAAGLTAIAGEDDPNPSAAESSGAGKEDADDDRKPARADSSTTTSTTTAPATPPSTDPAASPTTATPPPAAPPDPGLNCTESGDLRGSQITASMCGDATSFAPWYTDAAGNYWVGPCKSTGTGQIATWNYPSAPEGREWKLAACASFAGSKDVNGTTSTCWTYYDNAYPGLNAPLHIYYGNCSSETHVVGQATEAGGSLIEMFDGSCQNVGPSRGGTNRRGHWFTTTASYDANYRLVLCQPEG